jgi:hypothetical protein
MLKDDEDGNLNIMAKETGEGFPENLLKDHPL